MSEKIPNIQIENPNSFSEKARLKIKKSLEEYQRLANNLEIEVLINNELNEDEVALSLSKIDDVYIAASLDTVLGSVEIAIDKNKDAVMEFVDPDTEEDENSSEIVLDEFSKPNDKRSIKYLRLALMMVFDLIEKNKDKIDEVVVCASNKQREKVYSFLTKFGFKSVETTLDDGSESTYYTLNLQDERDEQLEDNKTN